MKRWLWLAVPIFLIATSWARPSPVTPIEPRMGKSALFLFANSEQVSLVPSKGGERTVAIVAPGSDEVRKARLALVALYAYDPHGNCVARDEYLGGGGADKRTASDDAAVEWFPPATGTYTVELRNQGMEPCLLQMAIR